MSVIMDIILLSEVRTRVGPKTKTETNRQTYRQTERDRLKETDRKRQTENKLYLKLRAVLVKEPLAVGQHGLDDATLLGHVRNHGHHVVVRGPDQSRTKDDGQISEFHLVDVAVGDDLGQVEAEKPQGGVVDFWQQLELNCKVRLS
jgi:hypothetical protein